MKVYTHKKPQKQKETGVPSLLGHEQAAEKPAAYSMMFCANFSRIFTRAGYHVWRVLSNIRGLTLLYPPQLHQRRRTFCISPFLWEKDGVFLV